MSDQTATAIAHPNIAFIKYWGNRDNELRLPQNGSISMNLGSLHTRTTVTFDDALHADSLTVNGANSGEAATARVSRFLDIIRALANQRNEIHFASVESHNNFPMGAGIASSAAAFAALALAGSAAAGLNLSESELSRLARRGSGSASRSIPGGFCEWLMGEDDETSLAISIAPAAHWPLTDFIAVLSTEHKKVGSSAGHPLAGTSPFQAARTASVPERLLICRNAILKRDFSALAEVSERDSTLMHAVMMTQEPPLFYWEPASLNLIKKVAAWRADGLPCFTTLDAGPNVHVLCPETAADAVESRLRTLPGITDLIRSGPGGPARLEPV